MPEQGAQSVSEGLLCIPTLQGDHQGTNPDRKPQYLYTCLRSEIDKACLRK
jgi:hypothetical protein